MSRSLLRSVLLGVLLFAAMPSAGALAAARLPDLEQEIPGDVSVTRAETSPGVVEYRLGFWSGVRNVGDGPMIIEGSRPDVATPTMRADQVIACKGCKRRVVRDVGRLQFVTESDHRHWHLLGFERYELRTPDGRRTVARDRKSGFCLGDRYKVKGVDLPERRRTALYTGRCGIERTELLSIREGISVGWGDNYSAFLEGQYLSLTGVKAGRYTLVHRVNRSRGMRETSYANNASSVAIRLRITDGVPTVTVLNSCFRSARCG